MSELDDREDVILRALQERIQEEGDSARRIARFLSVHGRVVEDWLSGVRRPRRATLERIETFLKAHAAIDTARRRTRTGIGRAFIMVSKPTDSERIECRAEPGFAGRGGVPPLSSD
jgi:hypothetical protein